MAQNLGVDVRGRPNARGRRELDLYDVQNHACFEFASGEGNGERKEAHGDQKKGG